MMELEPLLKASGKRNWRSIMLTHDEFPCHCLLQTRCYPGRKSLEFSLEDGDYFIVLSRYQVSQF